MQDEAERRPVTRTDNLDLGNLTIDHPAFLLFPFLSWLSGIDTAVDMH